MRWLGGLFGGLLSTILLLLLMNGLVPVLRQPPEPVLVPLQRIAIARPPAQPETSRRAAPLLRAPPELPPLPAASGGTGTFDLQPEPFVPDLLEPGLTPVIGIDTIDTAEPIPLVQISPHYPLREWSRGVEGYVDIRMDIDANGVPGNLRVVDSRPGAEFVDSALRSVASWRYAPVTIDGAAVHYQNYVVRVAFAIDGKALED